MKLRGNLKQCGAKGCNRQIRWESCWCYEHYRLHNRLYPRLGDDDLTRSEKRIRSNDQAGSIVVIPLRNPHGAYRVDTTKGPSGDDVA